MNLLCCFNVEDKRNATRSKAETAAFSPLATVTELPVLLNSDRVKSASKGRCQPSSLKQHEGRQLNSSGASTVPAPSTSPQEPLLQLVSVLTSLDGGWWDQLERAAMAMAQHLTATHVCIFLLSSDSAYASPVALAGPPAPPLCIGVPLPLSSQPPPTAAAAISTTATTLGAAAHSSAAGPLPGTPPGHPSAAMATAGSGIAGIHSESAPAALAAATLGSAPEDTSGTAASALNTTAAAGKLAAGGEGVAAASCAAAVLLSEQQAGRHPGRLLLFADTEAGSGQVNGGPRKALPATCAPEWRQLTAGDGDFRHFAAVAVPAGHQAMGVLSLGAEGPDRPSAWTPATLHCTAAMLAAPLRISQVDLACRALSELSSATTIHELVRILLGAAAELVNTVTRIETQARVALLQPDVEAAAVFQSAVTDMLGPAVRRRLSEVLLVDTSAAAAGNAGSGRGGGGGAAGLPPTRRSLGGTEALMSRCPSLAAAGTVGVDGQSERFLPGCRPVPDELPVCRGHSLPLKHTLLSEALTRGSGLCIADCNAYVQDTKVYPRDLALSRGSAPCQSLALATGCCSSGTPLLALYATYGSILPQGLLGAVVQELGQLLRALTPAVAAKLEGALSVEWGYLRHQLLDSMRNRSLRNLGVLSASQRGTTSEASPQLGAGLIQSPVDSDPPGGPVGAAAATAAAAVAALGVDAGGVPLPLSPTAIAAPLDPLAHLHPLPPSAYASGAASHLPGGLGLEMGASGAGSGSMGLLDRSRGAGGQHRDGRTSGRASFSLEAASSPRGFCKLAPLIATLHDRLKAAQAEQIANCRAASRMQDLESIRILEQIGRGGYGVVYRGLYHGSEVAIKLIQEAEVATTAAGVSCSGELRRMNSVALENKHLHDAIELVASVGMGGHPNIVQVLTFFTDVRVVVGDQPFDLQPTGRQAGGSGTGGGTLPRRLSGLDGVGQLLRLTRMPSTLEMESPLMQQAKQQEGSSNGGVIVLVQEFCDAGTLKTAINQRAFYRGPADSAPDAPSRGLQLNLRAVYVTLLEVALALRHMHGLHLVHCDLKPQNVLLKSSPRDPRGFTAKLSDFGLAKMMAHDDKGQLVIDEAVGSGTLTHMAPESLAGQKQLTASIDMFAFGILMWQMVCGTRLYQGLTTRQIIRGVVRENLRPAFPAWVPHEYRRLAERCWHPVASERPSASAVVSELEAMCDQHSRAVPAWRTWRTAAAVGPGGGGGGGGGEGGAGATAQRHQAQHQQQQHLAHGSVAADLAQLPQRSPSSFMGPRQLGSGAGGTVTPTGGLGSPGLGTRGRGPGGVGGGTLPGSNLAPGGNRLVI